MTCFIINSGARKIIKRFISFMLMIKLYEINTIWVVNERKTKIGTIISGMLPGFTVMLAGKLSEALTMMEKYVRENGKYVEESERTIAHYTL